MRLYYTPKSHFARKVRLVLEHLACEVELVDVGNVADRGPQNFGGNPLMEVPTLEDNGSWLIDSDHIAGFLSRKFDAEDRLKVRTTEVRTLNRRAVMNGVMSAEVEVLLARRTGIETRGLQRFAKKLETIEAGLAWLEAEELEANVDYLGFHLVSMWDHLAATQLVALDYPRIAETVQALSSQTKIRASKPPV